MRFERGLRSTTLKPYPVGYMAVPTDDFNRDSPPYGFGDIKDSGVWLGEQDLPVVIELSVRMTPIWVENETAFATLDKSDGCYIYPLMSVFSKVLVEATGNGYYQKTSGEEKITFLGDGFLHYKLDLPQPHLYEKVFLVQGEGKTINWAPREKVVEDVPFLWAYGAQQVHDDIHPLVFSLESVRNETCLRPSSLLAWRERGINPPIIGALGPAITVFQDVYEEDQTRTLKESIEAGMSVIYLIIGQEERGGILRIPYYSYRFAKNFIVYKRRG
jgi:hypothetical protein